MEPIDYGAAKAALVNLTKTLSQEFGPHGIRVNAVSPGPVATDLGWSSLRPGRKHNRSQLPHRRRPDQDNLKTRKSIYRTDPG
jgi:NAD(P)-dependent dehydrogenase (short-subunit alcohol dehydrogenase family)